MKKSLKLVWPYLRIALSVLLLWLAARNIAWDTLARSEIAIEPGWFLLGLLCLLTANALAAFRWGWIMRSVDLHGSWLGIFGLYLSGGLINQGLPSTIGGDSYRAIEASRQALAGPSADLPSLSDELHSRIDLNKATPRLRLSFVAVALDRMLGLTGNIVLGALGLILAGSVIAPWAQTVGWMLLAATAGGAIVSICLLGLRPARRVLLGILDRLGMETAINALRTALGWPQILPQLALSAGIHVVTIASLWLCLRAFGPWVPFEALMVGLPALSILMILPISISGWGLRETTLSAMLTLWGVPAGTTVLASVSFGILGLLVCMPGALFLFRRRKAGHALPGQ
ncbi:MAG: flippase-like domain-containing protein [Burkholderiaceae bacterium]|nr:flippase-like domain-containing protein [Burkholderiaceae bacterium]